MLAEKIAYFRKKNGWSQEELAERMGVSRQAVSKWESAQTVPDLEKILALSDLFGVSTDCLLKEEAQGQESQGENAAPGRRRVTLAQAREFLQSRRNAALGIAAGVYLCVLSPVALLILEAAAAEPAYSVSAGLATGAGLAVLLCLVAAAVGLFVSAGFKNEPFAFLDKEPFEAEREAQALVREAQREYRPAYIRRNLIGVCLCVLSPIPLFFGAFSGDLLLTMSTLAATLLIAGAGAALFVAAGVRWASMEKLLGEGEFSPAKKQKNQLEDRVGAVYWPAVTAGYLLWSFLSGDWGITWILWPVAGVLFGGVLGLCGLFAGKEK